MKLFKCQVCSQLLYFENSRCERCAHVLGYDPGRNALVALDAASQTRDEPFRAQIWRDAARPELAYRFCANATYGVCNWLVPAASTDHFCRACRHNGIIPDLSQPQNIANWRKIEVAKHRLIYTLARLGLPLPSRSDGPEGLMFHFLADPPFDPDKRVMTGHDNGLITLALAEADDVERERRRSRMGEPYRTLLGHFRHEVGHYYWDRLVRDEGGEEGFRATFGNHESNYGEALQIYYNQGAPADWRQGFVTAYATAHPWEDFAETFAHYLHIVDTIEMAAAFSLRVDPAIDDSGRFEAAIDFDPYSAGDFRRIVDAWLPMSMALNCINRCMGQPDFYPFILSPAVIAKLGYIHTLVRGRRQNAAAPAGGHAGETAAPALASGARR